MPEIKPGDTVTIRVKVLEVGPADLGMKVELFSKTDQYPAWIRTDLVTEHTPAPAVRAEPEPGAYLIGGQLAVNFTDVHHDPPPPDGGWWRYGRGWDWHSWPTVWLNLGGPDVTITPLVPMPEVALPWSSDDINLRIYASQILINTTRMQDVVVQPESAETLAAALISAARAARSKP